MASWPGPKKNYTSGIASWPWRKIIIHREWPAGPSENKIYIGNGRLAKPSHFIEDQWETVFPFASNPRKIIDRQQTKKYTSASGQVSAKKIIHREWPAGPGEKNHTSGMDAGWRSEFSMYDLFSPKNHRSVKFGQKPDALLSTHPAQPNPSTRTST